MSIVTVTPAGAIDLTYRIDELRCGELVRECGGTHALVVYGGGSAVRSGLLGRCTDSLKAAGIPYELLGGVQPNPRLSRVREGLALAKETGADFLLAVGGGSVIDTAKAIGYALANPELVIYKRGCYSLRFSFKMKVIG